MKGWSVADSIDGPLYDPEMNNLFIKTFKENLAPTITVKKENCHINDPVFATSAADMMDQMIASKK